MPQGLDSETWESMIASGWHTGVVFRFRRSKPADVDSAIKGIHDCPASPRLLSLGEANLPPGFVRDCHRSRLGQGPAAFAAALRAFAGWAQFDLGWVRVVNPEIPIAVGQIAVVEVHAVGLWSLNLSRIVETVNTETRFGFLYATSAHHAEEGEERFLVELDAADGGVWYHLEAVSRPRHALARAAYPLTRALQHRFARDSHARMKRAVLSDPGLS